MYMVSCIEQFIAASGWKQVINKNEVTGISLMTSKLIINNQPFILTIEGNETQHQIMFSLIPPFRVLTGKSIDACLLANFINESFNFMGRLTVSEDGELCYRDSITLAENQPSFELIHGRISAGELLFKRHTEQIAAVSLTRKTYEAQQSEYHRAESAAPPLSAWSSIKNYLKKKYQTFCNANMSPKPLAKQLHTSLSETGWQGNIEPHHNGKDSILSTTLLIRNQTFKFKIIALEEWPIFVLYLFPPCSVMDGKFVDATMLCNAINQSTHHAGTLSLNDHGTIRYREFSTAHNLEPSTSLIHHILERGVALFEEHLDAISAVALTEQSYESIRQDLEQSLFTLEA